MLKITKFSLDDFSKYIWVSRFRTELCVVLQSDSMHRRPQLPLNISAQNKWCKLNWSTWPCKSTIWEAFLGQGFASPKGHKATTTEGSNTLTTYLPGRRRPLLWHWFRTWGTLSSHHGGWLWGPDSWASPPSPATHIRQNHYSRKQILQQQPNQTVKAG